MKIDAFRTAFFGGSDLKHAMYTGSEYTLCGKSTAPETASAWDVSIPRLPSCITCLGKVMASPTQAMYDTSRTVLAYEKHADVNWFTYRGDFQMRVSFDLCNKADNWGLENAAKKARHLLDPERKFEMSIEVLNPETLYYEKFYFGVGEFDPSQ